MTQVKPEYELYPYQHQVLDELLAVIKPRQGSVVQTGRRVIAHLPTGAGKTRIACHAACHILNRFDSVGKAVIWLASTEELCQQASDDLSLAWQHLGNRPVNRYELWGNRALDLNSIEEGILVAGLPKLWAVARNDYSGIRRLAEAAALVIFDEAHQAIARTYRFITEQLVTYEAPLLGLTATPGRTAEVGEDDYQLAEMFNFNKVTIDPRGYPNPVVFLTTRGFLADPEFIPIEVESELDVPDPDAASDYSGRDLERVGGNTAWRDAIVDTTITALHDNQRVMVFCPSVQSVKDCTAAIRSRGFLAEGIIGTTPLPVRQVIVGRYRQGDGGAMALLNHGVFTAGFDAPKTRCVVLGRPTTSLVLYSQMAGRALRGPRSGGNRTCQIYSMGDSRLPGFASVAAAFRNWEELWRQN